MKYFFLFLGFIALLLLTACNTDDCQGKECQIECPNGYVKGSCNCECIQNGANMGLDEVFTDDPEITPPTI